MTKAFENFEVIRAYPKEERLRAWLLDYEGLHFSIGKDGQDLVNWKEDEDNLVYSNKLWNGWSYEGFYKKEDGSYIKKFLYANNINKIQRCKKRLVIEFDDKDKTKIPQHIKFVKQKLKDLNIGYILSSHEGKSDYIWVEFNRDISTDEGKRFLKWISPLDSEIDLNFTSDNFRFPVLFAEHWKYGSIEEPLEYNEGEQIDFDNLKIPKKKVKSNVVNAYETYKKRKKENHDESFELFTIRGQLERFWKEQPFYYDKSKIFWLWDKENYKWVLSDEIEFCNLIYKKLNIETINTKAKIELVEGFKQIGRMHRPKEIKKSWVQFKDKIYDVKTEEIFNASPEYFVTNPIPWEVGKNEDTPTIDKYFSQWVDEKYIYTLYQIIAYNICLDKFMQRIIALCGGGSNGKGTYIKLNYKFIGNGNFVSSEIKSLSEDKFEPFVLYRKTLCVMGEVSHDDLKNTNQLKKLGGEDKISFQQKGKTPFTDDNTATCICLTNSLPITPDKSSGFYRKWLIIDFPNQFKQINKNIIDDIPEIEFENLAKKCLRILKELYKNPCFNNEGNFEERAKKYEEHSNPVMKFIEEHCDEIAGEMTTLRDFTTSFNEYLKSRHLRIMNSHQIGKVLRDEGFIVGNRKIDFLGTDISAVVIVNLSLKTIETSKTIQSLNRSLTKETNLEMNSFKGINSSNKEIDFSQNINFETR